MKQKKMYLKFFSRTFFYEKITSGSLLHEFFLSRSKLFSVFSHPYRSCDKPIVISYTQMVSKKKKLCAKSGKLVALLQRAKKKLAQTAFNFGNLMEIVRKPMMICWPSESIDPAEMEGQVNEGNIRLPPLPIPAQLPFFITINTFVTCLAKRNRDKGSIFFEFKSIFGERKHFSQSERNTSPG